MADEDPIGNDPDPAKPAPILYVADIQRRLIRYIDSRRYHAYPGENKAGKLNVIILARRSQIGHETIRAILKGTRPMTTRMTDALMYGMGIGLLDLIDPHELAAHYDRLDRYARFQTRVHAETMIQSDGAGAAPVRSKKKFLNYSEERHAIAVQMQKTLRKLVMLILEGECLSNKELHKRVIEAGIDPNKGQWRRCLSTLLSDSDIWHVRINRRLRPRAGTDKYCLTNEIPDGYERVPTFEDLILADFNKENDQDDQEDDSDSNDDDEDDAEDNDDD